MLGQRRRRWNSIEAALGQRLGYGRWLHLQGVRGARRGAGEVLISLTHPYAVFVSG